MLVALLAFDPRSAAARYASIVIDADTGRVLHAVNADTPNFPASLTKMMTLYLVFEALESGRLKLDSMLSVSRTAQRRSPSKLGLRRGERISVRDIIGTLITKSANDAATVAAEALASTERKFARIMTRKARALGMSRTTFRNASGLPHWRQRSTARDMATLARALYTDFPQYYHFFSLTSYTYKGRTYRNHNRMLTRYDGMDGLKTGYIRASGYNVAASVERDGARLIGVMFGGRSPRWRDRHMARLLNRGFSAMPGHKTPAETDVAKAAPPVPRRKPVQTAAAEASDWSVYVGTFDRYERAHRAVTDAARAVPGLLRSRFSIRRSDDEEGGVYFARLTGLSEFRARRSCGKLRQLNIDCEVLPSGELLGQGSR